MNSNAPQSNAAAVVGDVGAMDISLSRLLHAYFTEAKFESIRLLRTPGFVVPTLLFPLLFYSLFGLVVFRNNGNPMLAAPYLFANYCAFGAMAPGLFGFGVSLAVEREQGVLQLKRALPMPASAYLFAKMLMAMLFVTIVLATLIAAGVLFGHVNLTIGQFSLVAVTSILGVLPFCAVGFFIGTLATGQGAPAITNMVYLPMSFLSGIWVPLAVLPNALQSTASFWPPYHLIHLLLDAAGLPHSGESRSHVLVLVGITVVFTTLAMLRLRRSG
jgi:ABC-2 type transport system permease protein